MLVSLLALGVWGAGTLRFALSPKAGIFWILTLFAFAPRSLGFGVGDGFALSSRRLIVLSLAGMLLLLILQKRINLKAPIPHLLAPVFFMIMLIYLCYIASSLFFTGSIFFVMATFEEVMAITVGFLAALTASRMPKGDRTLVIFAFLLPVLGTFGIVLVEMQVKEYILDFLRGGQASGIKIAAVRENSDGLLNIRDGRFRIAGLLGGPLSLAEYMVYASISFFYLYLRKYIKLPVLLCLLGLTGFMIFYTGSRGALFVYLVSILLMSLAYVQIAGIPKKFLISIIVVSLLAMVASTVTYNAIIVEDVQYWYLLDREERSLISRFSQYGKSLELIQSSPLIGFGIYRHPVFGLGGGLTTLDNHFLGILLRGGFIALFTFWAMLFYIYRAGSRFALTAPEMGLQALGFYLMTSTFAFSLLKIVLYHNHNHTFYYAVAFYGLIQFSRAEVAVKRMQTRPKAGGGAAIVT